MIKNPKKFIYFTNLSTLIISIIVAFYVAINIIAILMNEGNILAILKNIQRALLLSYFCFLMLYYYVAYKNHIRERLKDISESHAELKLLEKKLKMIAIAYGVMFFISFVAKILILRS